MQATIDLYLPRSHRDFVHFDDEEVVTNHGTYQITNIDEDEYTEWMDNNLQEQWHQNIAIQVIANIELHGFEFDGAKVERDWDNKLRLVSASITDIWEELNDADLNVPATKDNPQRKYYEFLEENNIQLIAQLADSMELAA